MTSSEFELIERIISALGGQSSLTVGPGDDAAVLGLVGEAVISVDSMVEGVHFPEGWDHPGDVAHRALAGALSDLAAMAARPRTALVALGLAADRDDSFLEGLADSMVEAARRFGVSLAGGDVVRSSTLFLSVTVIGDLPDGRLPVTRAGAIPGDLVAVTGRLGGSASGLALVTGAEVPDLSPELRESLVSRYLRPSPLVALGEALSAVPPTAMVDVSDGLAADLGHIAEASGVSIQIDAGAVPVEHGVEEVARAVGGDALGVALAGGEDYELAMTIAPERLEEIVAISAAEDLELTVIGTVGGGDGVEITRDGHPIDNPPGFEHSFGTPE